MTCLMLGFKNPSDWKLLYGMVHVFSLTVIYCFQHS